MDNEEMNEEQKPCDPIAIFTHKEHKDKIYLTYSEDDNIYILFVESKRNDKPDIYLLKNATSDFDAILETRNLLSKLNIGEFRVVLEKAIPELN